MAGYDQTIHYIPQQAFNYAGQYPAPTQYSQSIPIEQLSPYNLNQQNSYKNPKQNVPQDTIVNKAQINNLNSQTKRSQICSKQCVVICLICIGILLLIAAAFTVPLVVILTLPTDSNGSLSLYGVQLNLNPSSLPNSWSQCYTATYATSMGTTNLNTILSACNKNMLLLGCRQSGHTIMDVAAMGYRADVLYNCATTSNCRNVANGVGWYYSDVYSWGFANGTDSVTRSTCDTSSTNPGYRLCWCTQNNAGYRCGSAMISNTNYEKVIYHSN
ncbi:unnamed protein product [Adineta steineri]|uniref:Uncharacterized protein n=1 Tax=Adineta steineri TaxID=433720 RepID=A0A813M351_9BILA|nr:unnamed protein product [Adineta steineri]